MYNKDYSYENIKLWDESAWKDHYSPFCALSQYIEELNHENYRVKAGEGPYTGRTDGVWNGKTVANFYDDYINAWAEKGVTFKATEMGMVCWASMLPKAVQERSVKDFPLLVVLCDVDYSDPNWLIHNLLRYEKYNELAAEGKLCPLYICPDGVNRANVPINIMQEFSVIFNLRMENVYLDMSSLKNAGKTLSGIDGFYYTDNSGSKAANPDECIEELFGIPVLNITDRWHNTISGLRDIFNPWLSAPAFDPDEFIHSRQGREMADSMRIEYDYRNGRDPEFIKKWTDMGLDFGFHDYNGYQWLSLVPRAYVGQDAEKLPVVLIFQEVTYQDPYQPVSAIAAYRNYAELAATGQLIVLFFALEAPDDNDMFYDILLDAEKIYPIDKSRVYVTGQSHNGYFTDEFTRRHHEAIAACAPLSNHPGIPEDWCTTSNLPIPDEKIELSKTYDMPTCIVSAITEIHNTKLHCRGDYPYDNAARAYQRRLEANRCPVKSIEEIKAAMDSEDYIVRHIQYPVDRTDLTYRDGAECYIGDVKNVDGKYHLRLVIIENQTHFIAPQFPELSWDFLRRYARDLETGAVIERY